MQMNYFPREDTVRKKRKMIRKVKRTVRHFNRGLRKDIFGDRFSVVIKDTSVRCWSDHSGWFASFLLEFRDAENPARNYVYWFDYHNIIYSGLFCGGRYMDSDMNDFIVNSDFWEKYHAQRKNQNQ